MVLHTLAHRLSMTVCRLSDTMSWQEFTGWVSHFEEHPSGRDDDRRAALIMMSNGSKWTQVKTFFPTLEDKPKFAKVHEKAIIEGVDPALARGLASLMKGAVGG